jgi:F-type H+-transporting ATPase subunit delta
LAKRTLEAKRYAQAVFEIAKESNELDQWLQDLQRVGLLSQDAEFVSYMQSPKTSFDIKSKLLSNQVKELNPLVMNLMLLLTSKGKFGLISAIRVEYENLLNDYRGIEKAEVITAVPLEEIEKKSLVSSLEALSGKKIILSVKVDSSIIGGIVIKVGGKLIDGSTSSRLSALKGELAGLEG